MKNKKNKKNKKNINAPVPGIESSPLDWVRQMFHPEEYRIGRPDWIVNLAVGPPTSGKDAGVGQPPQASSDEAATNRLLAELANCLWYLKCKHFRREWDDREIAADDPRVRRALGRINKTMEALAENQVEVQDPTDQRYPPGGEGMMRPIQFLPTAGITFDRVSETVAPIIYRDDRLIQRGEVFVAVPKEISVGEKGEPQQTIPPAAEESEAVGNGQTPLKPAAVPREDGGASADASRVEAESPAETVPGPEAGPGREADDGKGAPGPAEKDN